MIIHGSEEAAGGGRVVVIGAAGFVGAALCARLAEGGRPVVRLSRAEVDLLAPGAAERLAGLLAPGDAVAVVAARAPVRDLAMLVDNLAMLRPVVAALRRVAPRHLLYVSSDAVYRDAATPLAEDSCAEPGSLHGAMHLARELVLRSEIADPLGIPFAIIRPTLIYGAQDPHDGYGPNRFRRLAARGQDIELFGEGEERRDHVAVEDVAELAARLIERHSSGVLNAATGQVASFREIAEQVVALFPRPVRIRGTPRRGPMPHGGYRPFDPAATAAAFPDFRYTALADGLARAHAQALASGAA